MTNMEKITNMFADGVESGNGHPYKKYSGCNVFVDGRTIYSYGYHFPMAYIVAPNVVWLNGDVYSVSTSRHQRLLREALARTDATVVIVPQRALDSAGIDYKTIEPVDVKPDRWEFTEHRDDTAPKNMLPFDDKADWYYSHGDYRTEKTTRAVGWMAAENGRQTVELLDDGSYRWYTARHWLGDCVFTAERRNGDRWTPEHGSPITRDYYVSSFDRQERRPLYFLSALPAAVDTFEAAIESLSPDSVKTAQELGRNVVRQGDMFAIPMDITRRELAKLGATFSKRKVSITLRADAQESIAARDKIAATMENMPVMRPREYGEKFATWRADHKVWVDELLSRVDDPNVHAYNWENLTRYTPRTWDKIRHVTGTALYGTAHTATEVATLPDGRQFATGTLYHEPAVIGETRDADHARRKLGKQWHLISRNTVPVRGTGTGRRNVA